MKKIVYSGSEKLCIVHGAGHCAIQFFFLNVLKKTKKTLGMS